MGAKEIIGKIIGPIVVIGAIVFFILVILPFIFKKAGLGNFWDFLKKLPIFGAVGVVGAVTKKCDPECKEDEWCFKVGGIVGEEPKCVPKLAPGSACILVEGKKQCRGNSKCILGNLNQTRCSWYQDGKHYWPPGHKGCSAVYQCPPGKFCPFGSGPCKDPLKPGGKCRPGAHHQCEGKSKCILGAAGAARCSKFVLGKHYWPGGFDGCSAAIPCVAGYYCSRSIPTSCKKRVGLGGKCARDGVCEAGLECAGEILAGVKKGKCVKGCSDDKDCGKGQYCGRAIGTRYCHNKRPVGSKCSHDSQCVGNDCRTVKLIPPTKKCK